MLTKYGYVEDAMKMATKTEGPSWGYWVENLGLTTLAEEWVVDPVENGSSLNHVFLGDVSAWMVNQLAGIKSGFYPYLYYTAFCKGFVMGKRAISFGKGINQQ